MQIELSTSEIDALHKFQRNLAGSSDYVCVTTCILMLSMGNSPFFVSDCLGIDSSGIYRYRNAYFHGKVGELSENRHKGYWGLLDCRRLSVLRQELKRHVYTDAGSVSDWICQRFLFDYNKATCRTAFFERNGDCGLQRVFNLRCRMIENGMYRIDKEKDDE